MQTISLPYGHSALHAAIPEADLLGIYESHVPEAASDPAAALSEALDHPIGSPRLEELAAGKRKAVIILSDHTRPVPSRHIIPQMLERLRRANHSLEITLLVATGCHRSTTREELVAKLGEEIVDNETIVMHNAGDDSQLVHCGTLPSGGPLVINRLALETDLLLSEGFIEPHFFAGFSGGRKSVLPGIASRETVYANHCSEFIQSPFARTGILENNPIHRDMLYAAQRVGLKFIVNVVINGQKQIVKAFAGDCREAHEAGCAFLRSFAQIDVPEADIVVTSNGGYPLDQNLYQAVKGMTAGEAACRPGGVIILAASCSDGIGGDSFMKHLCEHTPEELWQITSRIPRDATVPDQWQYQILARILCRHTVIVVTTACNHVLLNSLHLRAASTLDEALEMARTITGNAPRIAVIPDGVSVIVRKLPTSLQK